MLVILALGCTAALAEITVGIVNNPPSESGYREANVKDFEKVFCEENGYKALTFYSLKNDEQLAAAQQFITDGVDYLLISAAETTGWDAVLQSAQENGIGVFLFDRMIACDESLYNAAVVSDMANQGKLAVEWLISLNLPEYNIIHIQGAMGSDAQIGRTGALDKQVAENDNWTIVVQQTATWDEAEAKKIVESVINSKEDFRSATRMAILFAVVFLGLSVALVSGGNIATTPVEWFWIPGCKGPTYYYLYSHGLGAWMVFLSCGLSLVALISARGLFGNNYRNFAIGIFALMGAMNGTFLAADAVLFFFFFEAMVIPAAVLIAGFGGEKRKEAAMTFAIYKEFSIRPIL